MACIHIGTDTGRHDAVAGNRLYLCSQVRLYDSEQLLGVALEKQSAVNALSHRPFGRAERTLDLCSHAVRPNEYAHLADGCTMRLLPKGTQRHSQRLLKFRV